MTVSLTGKDTFLLGQGTGALTPLVDFGTGEVFSFTPANDIVALKTGKNGNSIYAYNATGSQMEAKVSLIRGSADDKRLNSILTSYISDPAAFQLISVQGIKRIGDGAGGISGDTYSLSGGVIKKRIEMKENVEGETDQALAMYELVFSNSDRTIA